MSRLLQLLLGKHASVGGGDAVAALPQSSRVQVEVADLGLHARARPLGERGPFTLRRGRELGEAAAPVGPAAGTQPRHVRPHVGEHGLLYPVGADAHRARADAAGVSELAPVDPVAVAVPCALQAVAAAVAAEQPREQMSARPARRAAGASLRELERRDVDERLVRSRVQESSVPAVGELAEVDAVSEQPVDGLLAPGARPLRGADARAFEDLGERDGAGAEAARLEDAPHDRRSLGVGFEAAVGPLAVADRRPRVNRHALLDRPLLRPLETGAGALSHVGGELKQDPRLQFAFGARPVGGRVGRVDRAARLGDLADEPVRVLAVAGETVEPGDDQAARLAGADAREAALQAGPLPLAAGLIEVDEHLADDEAALGGECAPALLLLVRADQVLTTADAADADVQVDGAHRPGHYRLGRPHSKPQFCDLTCDRPRARGAA